jgi:hypothetical protein
VSYSSTNWRTDQGPNTLLCDGRKHVMHASLKRDPYFPATAPALSTGRALVQICLFDASGLSIDYHMRTVRVTGR